MIDKETANKIKEAADIVDVVGDYVNLVKRGANYMGLCPFHNERTPSFSVNPRKNFCYCFSCHQGGSPVNFLMVKEGITYREALLRLADRYGIKVEERELTDDEKARQSERESMFVVNEWAMMKMQQNLLDTPEGQNVGLQYLYQRGTTETAVKAFRLGYAIDSFNSLSDQAAKEGYDLQILEKLGLIGKGQKGGFYDKFRGRVIYPILNTSGKTVAFGGRDLKGGPAKYINSPESSIYKKSNELYGMYQAKNAISKLDKCYLVEGYMDVIGMWQSGMENVVASSGTALTDGQISQIHRFTDNVTLIYDGDAAGIKAALRGIDMLLAHKLNVKVLLLPDGHDPDSFARQSTPESFREYVAEHETDIIRFKTRILVADSADDPLRRTNAIKSIVNTLAVIPDNIKRNVYIQECSALLGIAEEVVAQATADARAEYLVKIRKNRELEHIQREEKSSVNPSPVTPAIPITRTASPAPSPLLKYPLQDYEKEVLRYCVKYGMMTFCEGIDDDGNPADMTIYDFVAEEMEVDNVGFSVPIYSRIFDIIGEMRLDFINASMKYHTLTESEIASMRKEGYDSIAAKNLDINAIEKEEQELEKRLQDAYSQRVKEFAKDYVARELASHEEDDVRRVANEMVTDKYQLSKYHSKVAKIESESDKVEELVPRAISEWKEGILNQRLSEVIKKMEEASRNEDLAAVRQLQKESARLVELRRRVAKEIGERILSAR